MYIHQPIFFWDSLYYSPFLQRTSTGEPKILDLIDATGSGDVDMSCVRTTVSKQKRRIESLYGRVLRIPDDWCNPTGVWHVGVKSEYDFLPSAVKSRSKVCNMGCNQCQN